jgi:hypothetical protein
MAAVSAAALGADPVVDGKVQPGEYAHSRTLMNGKLLLSWQSDADGGLYLAVSARTSGWVAVGLGSQKMEGSVIYIGSVRADGTTAFSEDAGKGHGHAPAGTKTADQSAVGRDGEWTTVEVHVPAASLSFKGSLAPFIVAYAGSTDLTTWHGLFNHASGTLEVP